MFNLSKILNLNSLGSEEKIDTLIKTLDLLSGRLMPKIYQALSPEDRDQFEKLAEAQNEKAITDFLKNKIPNFENLVFEEFSKLKEEAKHFGE